MKVKIYGRSQGCKYCDRAKTICEMNSFDTEFIDVEKENIDAQKLQEITGTVVRTVPQIFVDDQYIGGCDSFEKLLKGK